jgi:hypothetical protein
MTQLEQQLYDALTALDQAVKGFAATKQPVDLMPLFRRIDELGAQLPPGTDPQLLHFLQRKSFEKATLWLEDRKAEITRGICGN